MFTNCREQGYCLTLFKPEDENTMVYWVCQSRNSDDIMVVVGTYNQRDNVSHCFNDDAFKSVRYFRYDEMEKAVDYVYCHIRLMYKNELDYPRNISFNTTHSLHDLERISMDVENLTYEDYHELATYENKTDGYSNDLIIENGKFNWQISKITDDEYKNIAEIDCEPNFNSEEELMIQMRDALNKFIDNEMEYGISMQDIRI